jgi:hypothetical protein
VQIAGNHGTAFSVPRMVYPVVDNYPFEIKRATTFKTCDIDSIFFGIGAALVVGIDATL